MAYDRRVLIIENDPVAAGNLATWCKEAGESNNPPLRVGVVKLVVDHLDEMIHWFDSRYPRGQVNPTDYFDFAILDVIFKAKGGQKQDKGGLLLWEHLVNCGIDVNFGRLVVVSNSDNATKLFKRFGDQAIVLPKKNMDEFINSFRELL